MTTGSFRAGRRQVFACTVLLLAGLPSARAATGPGLSAQQTTPPEAGTLKVRVEVVNVYAVVRDNKRLVPDLTRDDFELKEDGVPQEIKYFSKQTDTPLTMVLAVDTSGSQQRVLSLEQQQADRFLAQVMRPKDLTAVLHFDLDVELLKDFTNNVRELSAAVDETQINAGGQGPMPGTFPQNGPNGTHLYDAVYLASDQMLANEAGRKVLILLTDGQDEGSKETLDAALETAQKADVIIYAIDIADRYFYRFGGLGFNGESVLKKLTEATGGRVIRVGNERETAAAFDQIADELRTQYLLGYTPTNTKRDGSYRKIDLRVTHGGYKVQARRGYYASSR